MSSLIPKHTTVHARLPGRRTAACSLLCIALCALPMAAHADAETTSTTAPVRIAVDPDWPPFSFLDAGGNHQGINADILDLLEKRTGMQFELVPTANWMESETLLIRGEVDLIPGVGRSPERAAKYLFTKPYFTPTLVFISHAKGSFVITSADIETGRIALPKGYISSVTFMNDHPDANYILTENSLQALRKVAAGEADISVENLTTVSYLIRAYGLDSLKIAGVLNYEFSTRMAVRANAPELLQQMEEALDTISQAEMQGILAGWIYSDQHFIGTWQAVVQRIGIIIAAGALVIFCFIFWNRNLAVQLKKRHAAEAALQEANARLQSLNSQKDLFMAMAAHDLNNPLTQLKMSCDLLEDAITVFPYRRIIQRMRAGVERMSRLVGSLLALQKLEQAGPTSNSVKFDVVELVRKVVHEFTPHAADKGSTLRFQPPPENGILIHHDQLLVEQIVVNLISNAIKYTPEGGIIDTGITCDGTTLGIQVEDDGPGLTADEASRIFEPYAGISTQPTAGEISTGVGLSIVRSMVSLIGGRIEYSPGSLGGACFRVILQSREDGPSEVTD